MKSKSTTIDSFFSKVGSQKLKATTPSTTSDFETECELILSSESGKRPHTSPLENRPQKILRIDDLNTTESLVIERDPGLRQPLCEYSTENDREKIRREYLRLKAFQPLLDSYPFSEFKGHRRSFQPAWFKQFSWLEYSQSKDAAFCLPCFLFADKPKGPFINDGFRNWKKVNCGMECAFLVHTGKGPNSVHKTAQKACDDLMNPRVHIRPALISQSEEDVAKKHIKITSFDRCGSLVSLSKLSFQRT